MTYASHQDELTADRFARSVTSHLDDSLGQLPYVVTERLRAGREQAVALRKKAPQLQVAAAPATAVTGINADGTVSLGYFGNSDNTPLWIRRVITALPLVGLLCALAFLGVDNDSRTTVDVAELDAALLTSELPPAAYTDPGFLQFLQTSVNDQH